MNDQLQDICPTPVSQGVINVDGLPAYARAIAELKLSLDRRCRCRPSPYWHNIIEQGHRFIKKRIAMSLGFRSADLVDEVGQTP